MGSGFAQWAGGVRNRMANDPGRADFKDQVQCHGYLFLHEYLDDVLNGPRPENVIELTKTPGRNKTASKRTRAANVSPQKSKPAIPLSFPTSPTDKENLSAPAASVPQSKGPSRFQHALFTARDDQDDAPHTRDSISRATPNRPGVPVFGSSSKLQSTPSAAPIPSDDPLSPFRDAESPEKSITAQQIFTARLVIQPSSPVAEPAEPVQEVPATAALEPKPQPTEVDLSVIQEDDEGVSINLFEDARSDFSRPSAETKQTVSDEEQDITMTVAQDKPASQPQEVSRVEAAPIALPADVLPEPTKAPSSPMKAAPAAEVILAPKKSLSPIKTASPTKQQLASAQIPPSPPASEDALVPSPKKSTPFEQESEPISAVSASEPPPEPTSATSSKPEQPLPVVPAPPSSAPTPPPEPEHVEPTPRPLPVPPPMSRANSQNQIPAQTQTQARPAVPVTTAPQAQPQPPQSRASAAPRGAFNGPSLKDLRREPSVSGAAHRELRQSSWRKKPEGGPSSTAGPATTSAPAPPVAAATTELEQPRKRKSSVLNRPGASKLQRMRSPSRFSSSSPSPSRSSSEEEETELQVPIKDEDSGSGWSSGGGSMLEDLRHRLARLEKSTSGKTPAASRTWTSSATTSTGGLGNSSGGGRMSLSDLSLKSKPASSDAAAPETEGGNERGTLAMLQDEVSALGLSTDAARASIRSTRTTTPDNSPPPPKARVLPAPPVFALPSPVPAPVQPTLSFPPPAPIFSQPTTESSTTTTSSNSDAVRAAARAEAARFFAGTKVALPVPSRTETQSTIATDIDSIFDRAQSQTQTEFTQVETQVTGSSLFGLESEDLIDLDGEGDLELDVDVEGDEEMEEATKASSSSRATSLATSTTQTRSMAKKGPVKSIQLAAAAAKKAAEEQDRKTTRMREMEERRQAAALRKAEEDKSKTLDPEKKRKEREELAASKSAKPPVKKPQEDANKKRKVEAEKKPAESKKPAGSSLLKEPSMSKSRIAKPTASTAGPSGLKSALKTSTNPFAAPAPPAAKTIKHVGSSSSLKSVAGAAAKKANKASISDAPGQALQAQMQARVQAQLKAAQKEPEVQSESIELPDINSEYSDSEDEDRGKDFPEWTQSPELKQALRDQETFNPDAIFGPIQPLKMGDLFKTGHSRFRKRTSSANWSGTDGITVEEEIEYARRMGYTN